MKTCLKLCLCTVFLSGWAGDTVKVKISDKDSHQSGNWDTPPKGKAVKRYTHAVADGVEFVAPAKARMDLQSKVTLDPDNDKESKAEYVLDNVTHLRDHQAIHSGKYKTGGGGGAQTPGELPEWSVTADDYLDLDVDSDNDGKIEPDSRDEDDIEEADDELGKVVRTNDFDEDKDGIADFCDGFDANSSIDGDNSLKSPNSEAFAELQLRIDKLHEGVKPEDVKYTFTYTESAPAKATVQEKKNKQGKVIGYTCKAPAGLRIWLTKSETRNKASVAEGGDFVPAGTKLDAKHLEMTGGSHTFYVESVPGAETASVAIEVVAEFTSKKQGKTTLKDRVKVYPLKLEVLSDLNNNGKISLSDRKLKQTREEDDPESREYALADDKTSNGLWDKSDKSRTDKSKVDDDAEALRIVCKPSKKGFVWFDHDAIKRMRFYEDKAYEMEVKFPLDLSKTTLPQNIYLRISRKLKKQVDDDLEFCFGLESGKALTKDKVPLTVLKEFGDKAFFLACRDYILESNTRVCTRLKSYGKRKNIRITAMREEATRMRAVETYWRKNQLWGIDAVSNAYPQAAVLVNGNMAFAVQDVKVLVNGQLQEKRMTSKCHGRLIRNSRYHRAVSSDNVRPPEGSLLAGPSGKYIAMKKPYDFAMARGRVPLAKPIWAEALGGYRTNYNSKNVEQMVGIGKAGKRRLIFHITMLDGAGYMPKVSKDAASSGVPAMPGEPTRLMLMLGDGGTSRALVVRYGNDQQYTLVKGSKHAWRILRSYCINTYLAFYVNKPRKRK